MDYGNVETVPLATIRQLPDETANFPAQAIPCALYGIIVTDAEVSSLYCQYMAALAENNIH